MKKELNDKKIVKKVDSLIEKGDYDKLLEMAKDSPNYLFTYVYIKDEEIRLTSIKIDELALVLARALSEIKEEEVKKK